MIDPPGALLHERTFTQEDNYLVSVLPSFNLVLCGCPLQCCLLFLVPSATEWVRYVIVYCLLGVSSPLETSFL